MNELRVGTRVTPTVTLVRPLGQGGMGMVWVAEHTGLKTEVVVKFMAKEFAEHAEARERFAREAAASASVKSPHVVQVFDYGLTDGQMPYIVMEFLEGRDLSHHLEAHGPMSPLEIAALVTQVAKALGKAHQVGVVHRDIKPDNIFLCDAEGGELFVKLLDFGIAKRSQRFEGSATTTGQVVGTPFYMSPEQILGAKTVDARSDIWSLGAVVFEALTGRRPFDGPSVGAITMAIHADTPKPSDLKPELTTAIDDWFARACAQDPSARFESAREAAKALQVAVGDLTGPAFIIGQTRAAAPTLGEEDLSSPSLAARSTTHLSSAFAVQTAPRRAPIALVAVALLVVLGLGALAVIALKKPAPTAANATVATTSALAASSVARIPDAPSAMTSATPDPIASAAIPPAVSVSKSGAKPHGMAPATTRAPTRPVPGTPKRPNDDDIK